MAKSSLTVCELKLYPGIISPAMISVAIYSSVDTNPDRNIRELLFFILKFRNFRTYKLNTDVRIKV